MAVHLILHVRLITAGMGIDHLLCLKLTSWYTSSPPDFFCLAPPAAADFLFFISLAEFVHFAIFLFHFTMEILTPIYYNPNCKQNRKGPPPFTHFIPPFIHIEKTRYPQYLVFCCLSSFIICNPPDGPPGSYPPDLNNDPVLLPAAVPPQVRSGAPESRFDCIFCNFGRFLYPRAGQRL